STRPSRGGRGSDRDRERVLRGALRRAGRRTSSSAEVPSTSELRKPSACPECGQGEISRIVYGLPTQETLDRAVRGEFELGGCLWDLEEPDWVCKGCAHRWPDA